MEVRHYVRCYILIVHIALRHITVLIYLLNRTACATKRIGTGSIFINTCACRHIPPVCQFQTCIKSTCKTGCFVCQSILIQNPIRVFYIIFQILQAFQYTVFATIIIQITAHLVIDRPSINSGHCAVTSLSVQARAGQRFIGTCL